MGLLIKTLAKLKLFLYFYGFKKTIKLNYDKLILTFYDDFDGNSLNTDLWLTQYYWGNTIESNNEAQWYISDSFAVKDSILTIKLKEEEMLGWVMVDGIRQPKLFNLTSGLIHTGESFRQKYGRFEIYCKLSHKHGLLPSFWLIEPSSYPPEIDVFEFSGVVGNAYNVGFVFGDDDIPVFKYSVFNQIRPVNLIGWNKFTLDWTPTELSWYFNGILVYRYSGVGIPQTPMYVAVNLAADNTLIQEGSQEMLIDWVKIYKYRY